MGLLFPFCLIKKKQRTNLIEIFQQAKITTTTVTTTVTTTKE